MVHPHPSDQSEQVPWAEVGELDQGQPPLGRHTHELRASGPPHR